MRRRFSLQVAAVALIAAQPAQAQQECVRTCPDNDCSKVTVWIVDPHCKDPGGSAPAKPDPAARQAEVKLREANARAESLRAETEQARVDAAARQAAARAASDGASALSRSMRPNLALEQAKEADATTTAAAALKLPLPRRPWDSAGTASALPVPVRTPERQIPPENQARAAELTKERDALEQRSAETARLLDTTSDLMKRAELKQKLSELGSQKGMILLRLDDLSARPPSARGQLPELPK